MPQLLPDYRDRIREGGLRLGIPRGLAHRELSATRQWVSQQGDYRKQAQQHRSRPLNGQVRPLALGLYSQVRTDFRKGYFHLPAPEKPLQDLTRLLIELRAQ